VVFMGMGEPLLNWDAVAPPRTHHNHPQARGIGARHNTVSTVGIVPALAQLAKRPEQFRLAISLHAPTSEARRALMPIDRKYPLADVMKAIAAFSRRVTFEYVMIAGRNDRDEDLLALAALARKAGALVNLLPLHPGGGTPLEPTSRRRMATFLAGLHARGVEAVLRRSRGLDIAAACGQLRIARPGPGEEVAAESHRDVHQAPRIRHRARHTRP
jgi:23S rRNA (adenine2503-C2)-methyltransferase